MSTVERGTKIYYDVNLADQTIVSVASKPKGCRAEEALSRILQLVNRVVNRHPHDSLLSEREKKLTPGYTLLHIRTQLSEDPIPALNERQDYNLHHADAINLIVHTIIEQYQETYEKEACCLRKLFDRFVLCLGGDTTFTRMQRMQGAIQSGTEKAGQQAANYIDYVCREQPGIGSLSSSSHGHLESMFGDWAQRQINQFLRQGY